MKNVTNILSEEHQNILRIINVILKECNDLEQGKNLEKSFFEKAIDFIKNYADTFHHAKEEDILFKVMCESTGRMHCNPIPVMLHEHETGRQYVKGMEESLKENNKQKIIENAQGYAYLLQDHIYKEENILYPMAEQSLDEQQRERILKMYDEAESKITNLVHMKDYFKTIDKEA